MTGSDRALSENNFDVLRLLFAATVCLVHFHELSGFQELRWFTEVLSTAVAVKAFFVVSGFLIFMSCEHSPSLRVYASRRARRIYPAYCTVVLLCALGLAATSTLPASEYFSLAWIKYLLANLCFLNFLQPTLPGVFAANPVTAVNGALWTLKVEVMFYLSVPLFVGLFRRLPRLPTMIVVYGASVVYGAWLTMEAQRRGIALYGELARQLPGQLSYFMSGAFLYYHRAFFASHRASFLLAAVFILAVDRAFPLPAFEPFALAVIVVFFARFPYLGNFGKHGDFSYGAYILHFPIAQLFVHSGWFVHRPYLFLLVVVLTVAAAAVLMWHLVEKRFLFRSSHYISTTVVVRGTALARSAPDDIVKEGGCRP